MSIKLMSMIWESAEVSGSELLVLLALADYSNDDGTRIYPSIKTLAKKARLSPDQTRRVIHKLIADGFVELVEMGGWDRGRNRSNEYRIVLDSTGKLLGTRKMQAPSTDASTGTCADARGVLAPVQDDPSYNHHEEPPGKNDDDNARARGDEAVFTAWAENVPGTMTPILAEKLHELIDECGAPSVIHGIVVAVEAGARNYKYIAACARNHAQGNEAPQRAQHRNSAPKLSDQEKSAILTRAKNAQSSIRTAEQFGGRIDPAWHEAISKAREIGVL